MSGRSYGSIPRVTNNGDGGGNDIPHVTSPKHNEEEAATAPLLQTVNPPSNSNDAKAEHQQQSSSSIGIQTDSTIESLQSTISKHWSQLTFNWISPLLQIGNTVGQLNINDLETLPLPKDCTTDEVYTVFSKCWEVELDKARRSLLLKKNESDKVDVDDENEKTVLIKEEGGNNNNNDTSSSSYSSTYNPNAYQPSLIKALYHAFGSDFLRAGLLKLIHDASLFVGPQVLNRLIQFMRNRDASLSYGIMLMIIVTLSQIVMSISLRHYFYKCYTCGLRIRTAVVIAIYKKSLVLSLKERHAHGGPGEIANLVGIDAQRLQDLMTYLHAVWYSFFQIGLAMYFLWGQVGPSCLAGVVVIVFLIPITKSVAAWLGRIQKILMKARDERVALNNEILGAMKIIKLQAWEESFRTKLLTLRDHELYRLKRYFITSAISITMYSSAPLLVALATFAAYTMSGHTLDVAEALTALALFDIIRFPMFMLPQIINRIVEAGISFERVREFLLCEEYSSIGEGLLKEKGEVLMKNGTIVYDSKKPRLDEADELGAAGGGSSGKGGGGIRGLMKQHQRMMQEAALDRQWEMMLLKAQLLDAEDQIEALNRELHPERVYDSITESGHDVTGQWSPSSLLSLRRVTMHCKPGEFVAVVGAVGAGKSTLINSILGEGRPLTGSELSVKGKLGCFLQTPFIMNDTVRNNILFGHTDIDENRYKLALDVCSLEHDLKLLQHGDQTEIGEKGITLSGGQKARVSLARAVYHDADIYLLDDPLAAVDAHVGKSLFNNCIVDELLLGKSKTKEKKNISSGSGVLGWLGRSPSKVGPSERNSTIILVTNALQHLSHPMVDKILVLGDGCVQEVGNYEELSANESSRFSAFLKTLSETSTAAIDQVSTDDDLVVAKDETNKVEDASEDALEYGGDEPDVSKVIHDSPRRGSASSVNRKTLTRKLSSNVRDSSAKLVDEGDGTLMTDEFKERSTGSVDLDVYISWAKAGGGLSVGVAILVMFVVVEALTVTSKWWLTYWSQSGGRDPFFYLSIYALVNFSAIFATFCRLILFILAGLRSSRSIFENLLEAVLQAPMSFFDTTPVGRIINRFSKDMYTVDEQLVVAGRSYLATMFSVLSTIFVVTAVTPVFILGLIPIGVYYFQQQSFFTRTYRELKRLDSVTRSPIYALLGETLDGVLTIRAFKAEKSLSDRMVGMLDVQQTAYHLTFASQCWLSVRLEFAGTLIVMTTCLVAVMGHITKAGDEVFAGLAGLSISFALSITSALTWSVRMASDLEANMVAVERIQQYFKIPGEAPRLSAADETLALNWPTEGKIEFINVCMRYRPGLPLVLKGLNISIPARAKVGVVGRTGAGKSTLMVALLRIVELHSGSIKIDGIDIRLVGLKKLRSMIAVIPQDPVLFSGTIRSNLDPFEEYDDSRLFEVLEYVGLYSVASMMEKVPSRPSFNSLTSLGSDRRPGGRAQPIKSLSDEVSEGGTNFSVGQRQLIVIARAMLTGASIVIMDEATASVDADTDARIQRVFRQEFKNATCITVAHRLNTIMDSDLVLVMDAGKAAEFDKPSALLSQKDGLFKGLVDAWEEEN